MQQSSSDEPRVRDDAGARVEAPDVLVDVGAVLEAALQRAASALEARTEVTCEFDSQLRVLADPELLCLVFLNLLLMAASRMDAHGRATNGIRIAGWRTASQRTVVEISDSGHPIPTNQLAALFDEPVAVSAPAESGLGLPASQRVVRALGGAITVRSEPGGTSFRVELPTADS